MLLVLLAVPLVQGDPRPFVAEGVFATAAGVSDATVAVEGLCELFPAITLTLTPRTPGAPEGTRVAWAKHVRAPDPCPIAIELPRAWSWTLLSLEVQLEGEIVSLDYDDAAIAFEGRFQEGALGAVGTR